MKWELLLDLDRPVDILVLGDSSMNQGLDTDYIAETEQVSALNLATNGALISVNDVWMLERYLKDFGSPACVVVGHTFDIWQSNLSYPSVAQIPIGLQPMLAAVSELPGDDKDVLKLVVAKYFRAYSENKSLRQILMHPLSTDLSEEFQLSDSGFFAASQASPENVRKVSRRALTKIASRPFAPSQANKYSLERLVQLADEHGFRLYLVNGPIFHGLYAEPQVKEYLEGVNRFLSSYADKSEQVELIFAQPLTFGATEMQNPDHLVREAARRYTKALYENVDCE